MSDIAERLTRTALEDVSGYMLGEAADEICRLRKNNEYLQAAAESIVKWWLEEGMKHFDGAPFAIFAIRQALERNSAAVAAIREGGKDGRQ